MPGRRTTLATRLLARTRRKLASLAGSSHSLSMARTALRPSKRDQTPRDHSLRSRLAALVACLSVACAGLGAPVAQAAPTAEQPAPAASARGASCVSYTTQAIYNNYGYDHWVQLSSACSRRAECKAVSDVNPTGVEVSVEPGKTASALLFRGSPASEFKAQVTCSLAPRPSSEAQPPR